MSINLHMNDNMTMIIINGIYLLFHYQCKDSSRYENEAFNRTMKSDTFVWIHAI